MPKDNEHMISVGDLVRIKCPLKKTDTIGTIKVIREVADMLVNFYGPTTVHYEYYVTSKHGNVWFDAKDAMPIKYSPTQEELKAGYEIG